MPKRLRDLEKALKKHGVSLEQPKGGGSHWKFAADNPDRKYPIPAHNGKKSEISDVYIKALCRHFGIDPDDLFQK
ncbi:MAG: type II toxin-antitoxin system HicA family toxin [Polyangiales bacterium]